MFFCHLFLYLPCMLGSIWWGRKVEIFSLKSNLKKNIYIYIFIFIFRFIYIYRHIYIHIYIYRQKILVWKRPFGCAMSSDVAVTHKNLYPKWELTPAQLRKKYDPGNEYMEPKNGRAPVSRRNKANLEIIASGSAVQFQLMKSFCLSPHFCWKATWLEGCRSLRLESTIFFKQIKHSATTKWAPSRSF